MKKYLLTFQSYFFRTCGKNVINKIKNVHLEKNDQNLSKMIRFFVEFE